MEKELNKQLLNNFMHIEQPLVRNIENIQRNVIYLSSHIGKIKGWNRPDTMCLIYDLMKQVTKDKYVYVHK